RFSPLLGPDREPVCLRARVPARDVPVHQLSADAPGPGDRRRAQVSWAPPARVFGFWRLPERDVRDPARLEPVLSDGSSGGHFAGRSGARIAPAEITPSR